MINKTLKRNILLVEDEYIIAFNEKIMLEDYGYNVIIFNNGEKAIDTVNQNFDIHLILMDIDLGKGIDGTETAQIILQKQDIPIVFLSSHSKSNIVDKTEKITSYGYILKSSSITVIDASIKMAFKLFESKLELKNKDDVIRNSEKRFNNMLNVVPDMISIQDKDMNILYSNWNGFSAVPQEKRILNTKCYKTYRNSENICPDCLAKTVFKTKKIIKKEAKLPDGTWVELRVIPFCDNNDDDNIIIFMEWVRDITKRKEHEEKIKNQNEALKKSYNEIELAYDELQSTNEELDSTLEELRESYEELASTNEEKEVLLNEIHHRVKNNLQIVQSLLNMQKHYAADEKVNNVIEQCVNRINSMSLLHESLYQNDNLSKISMKNYIQNLISNLASSYTKDNCIVSFNNEIDNIHFDMQLSLPIGLLLNEIITNSIKHAFKDRREGSITTSLKKQQDDKYLLKIADDGIGLPHKISISGNNIITKSNTYGMTLINLFSKQLGAELKINRKNGTEFI